ncbi:MAG: hypothetical protein LBR69_07990 [Endomicrobium sp.]|jgi:hypothetical protein|nr:hypothetical protein [Endomicrobium sp.]
MSLFEKIKSLFCGSGKCAGKKKEEPKEKDTLSETDLDGDSSVQQFEDDGAEIEGADAVAEEITERPMKE